ncbi:unnamed protein product [Rotaria sp. Silwood2]|nr:unnamed protein product [Rotaria sp. Silwood2]CAF2641274.1 unnamed protein product [Rotaria sp. Silwood2]CAF2915616.1 unnamed protein product [Rotaria sp. Silwood2]CAF4039800.1 unnamed protein product [Rotaria sp. Silwood2]CAF4151945.1 unnamed protein product [Rotaria sp. Silwood2]
MFNGKKACLSENKCGEYGYCHLVQGEISCECKFWWEGEFCDQQSNSGKQVIILACLTAIIMVIFYSLQIIRNLYKIRKKRKENKEKEALQDTTLIDIVIKPVKKSTPVSSRVIATLVILVATGTLLTKCLALTEIHDEIVDRYKNKQPIYFNRTSFCDALDIAEFNVVTVSVGFLLIIICILMTKRMSLMRNRCYGYGAPPISVDFLSHLDRKFAAVVFAIIADELLAVVLQLDYSSDSKKGILVTFLLRLFQVIIMGCRFYPILSSVYINSTVTLLCATIYAWLDYSFTILTQGMCYPAYYPTYEHYLQNSTDIYEILDYYGTGPALIVIEVCSDIPRYLCLAYISVKLPVMLVEKMHIQRKRYFTEKNKILVPLTREERLLLSASHRNSIEMLYVRNLFRSANQRPHSRALFARLIPKSIYEWRDDFQFSSRVLCLYSSIFFLLFFVTIQACVDILPSLDRVQDHLQTIIDSIIVIIELTINIFSHDDDSESRLLLTFPLPNLAIPYLCGIAMAVIIIIIQLLVLLASIRRNLLQAYRGDDSEIPRRQRSNYVSYAVGNFHFAGYFIGYFIWAFIIIAVFSTAFCISIGTLITYGSVEVLEKILKFILPSLLLVTYKSFLNKLLAQYIFLQHYGDVLALNHRRLFMIFIYFNFFLDAFLGFVSSILRFVNSIIATTLYMARLDYSPLGRKLESFDSGFNAYCGFIHTECTHRHPVMLVFVSHLFSEIKKQQYAMTKIDLDGFLLEGKLVSKQKKPSRYIRKWRLAAFLVRNPSILFFRKSFLHELSLEDRRALNDVDNNKQYNVQRGIASYMRQMAVKGPSLTF